MKRIEYKADFDSKSDRWEVVITKQTHRCAEFGNDANFFDGKLKNYRLKSTVDPACYGINSKTFYLRGRNASRDNAPLKLTTEQFEIFRKLVDKYNNYDWDEPVPKQPKEEAKMEKGKDSVKQEIQFKAEYDSNANEYSVQITKQTHRVLDFGVEGHDLDGVLRGGIFEASNKLKLLSAGQPENRTYIGAVFLRGCFECHDHDKITMSPDVFTKFTEAVTEYNNFNWPKFCADKDEAKSDEVSQKHTEAIDKLLGHYLRQDLLAVPDSYGNEDSDCPLCVLVGLDGHYKRDCRRCDWVKHEGSSCIDLSYKNDITITRIVRLLNWKLKDLGSSKQLVINDD